MARAISPHGRYELQLIEAPVKRGLDQSGNVVEYTEGKPINAQFEKAGLTDWEQLAALEHFNFSGLPEGVFPLTTVSVWDSEAQAMQHGWSDEFHAQVEDRLRKLATLNPNSVLVVDPPAKVAPWNKYDEQDFATIFQLAALTGADAGVIRLYEFENQGREEILDACQAITDGTATWDDFTTQPDPNPFFEPITKIIPNENIIEGVVGTAGPEQITQVTFPHNSSPGRWTLSNGEKIQGDKAAALAAEAALTTPVEVVVVDA